MAPPKFTYSSIGSFICLPVLLCPAAAINGFFMPRPPRPLTNDADERPTVESEPSDNNSGNGGSGRPRGDGASQSGDSSDHGGGFGSKRGPGSEQSSQGAYPPTPTPGQIEKKDKEDNDDKNDHREENAKECRERAKEELQ